MKVPALAICLISALFLGLAYADEKPLSQPLKEEKKNIENTQQQSTIERKKAKLLADQETLIFWDEVDPFFEAKAKCFDQKDEADIQICLLKTYVKLATAGNFVAQFFLGKYYQNERHNEIMALQWYKSAIDNPRTPGPYKTMIIEDLEALQKTLKTDQSENVKPLSANLQALLDELKKNQEILALEKEKAQLFKDESVFPWIDAAEETFYLRSKCMEKSNEADIVICILEEQKRLAEAGNFYAQHELGNWAENGPKNIPEAIKWYQKALANPKTPNGYKPQIEEDLKRAKGKE